MSPDMKRSETKRPDRTAEGAHERACLLAAESIDAPLQPTDAAWLAGHLASCPDCAAAAREHRSIRGELRGLVMPEPPRDLWARTSAALDAVDSAGARRMPGLSKATRSGNRPLLFTAVAVGVIVVVTATAIMQKSPVGTIGSIPTPSSLVAIGTSVASDRASAAPAGPLAVVGGTRYWIASNAGVYEIKSSSSGCPATNGSCSAANGQTLGSIASGSTVSAAIAPDAKRAAVWTADKIAVVPLSATPKTVLLDELTPRPSGPVATTAPTISATPTSPTTPPTSPTAPATEVPTASPAGTPEASPSPRSTPSPVPSVSAENGPIAILSGYEIVGRDPEFSADGTMLAFAARPADRSTGPDVFVWRIGQQRAEPVTFRHADLLAGWNGRQILVSEISAAGVPSGSASDGSTSCVLDPGTGTARQIDVPMLLPALDPAGRFLVYWSGTVEFDPESGLWQPGTGDLYFDKWSDLTLTPVSLGPVALPTESPSPTIAATPDAVVTASPLPSEMPEATSSDAPAAGPDATSAVATDAPRTQDPGQSLLPQVLPVAAGPNQVHSWIVRWDESGHLAIWVADRGSSRSGRVSVFSVDRTTGLVNPNEPILAVGDVLDSIAFDDGHLVYTSAVDGRTHMEDIPAVPPSAVSTPSPTTPGETPSEPAAEPSAAEPTEQTAPLP